MQSFGLRAHISTGEERTIIGAIGEGKTVYNYMDQFIRMEGVDRVVPRRRLEDAFLTLVGGDTTASGQR